MPVPASLSCHVSRYRAMFELESTWRIPATFSMRTPVEKLSVSACSGTRYLDHLDPIATSLQRLRHRERCSLEARLVANVAVQQQVTRPNDPSLSPSHAVGPGICRQSGRTGWADVDNRTGWSKAETSPISVQLCSGMLLYYL